MTDREKLIEIIDNLDVMSISTENFRHSLADYLISNGIVVREKSKWITVKPFGNTWKCKACGHEYDLEDDITPYDLDMFFCPNCGADMRKGDND